jgi:hypothetical protein
MNFPIILTFIIGLVSAGLIYAIWGGSMQLDDHQKFSNTIQLMACAGAFISVVYVISSYITTNKAFISSQKPILSIRAGKFPQTVVRDNNFNEKVQVTRIDYMNPSNNAFYDLTISVQVLCGSVEVVLNDLFKPSMYLGPHDSRNRNFVTEDILLEKGFNLERQLAQGKQVSLQLGFTYTFLGKQESVKAQTYIWSPVRQAWEIET